VQAHACDSEARTNKMIRVGPASTGNLSLAMTNVQLPNQPLQRQDDPLERIAEVLRINARRGFFHAMLSYRVTPDQDFVTKIHDRTHMLNSSSFRQSSNSSRALDSFPWPKAFQRHEAVSHSSLRLFQDSFCLKDGNSWEGDGRTNSGGFLGALRLSVVFAPVFSAQQQNGSILPVGSVGQMIELGQQDKQDNVLLELIVAREFHIMGKKCKSKALFPCSCILPLFRNECVWDASLQLPNSPSAKTNQKALHMMQLIGLEALASEELRNGSLTVADVWSFFCQFQGVKLYDHGSEKYQMEAAAQTILNVVKDVMSEFIFRDSDMNCAQLYELVSFLSALNIPHYTGILASHNITSVQQLSHLFDHGSDKLYHLIAEDGNRIAHDSSLACELTKLRSAAAAASESPMSKPLDVRFRRFVDSDASFVTAMQSSSFVDILLSKKLMLAVFSVLIVIGATICLVQLLFPNSDEFLVINRFNQNATFFGLAIGIYVVKAIAVLTAHIQSPRSGRYVLAFAVFLWFLLSLWKYIVSVRSAVYEECQLCSAAEKKDSVALNILQLPCWPLVFGPACVFIMIKQHLFIPLILSAFFVVVMVPTCTSVYTGGSLTVIPFVIFYVFLYVLFRSFVYLGNRRAKQIYEKNASMINAKFNEMILEHQGHQTDSLAILRSRALLQESGATSRCWCSFNRLLRLCFRMQPSNSSQVLPFSLHFGNDTNPDFHNLNATHKTPVLQSHSTFESLISDAEFINFPFQEWASSWLSSGVESNADSVSKYLWCAGDSVDPEFVGLFPTKESHDVISGMHVRGPVKHIDRAIAKVELHLPSLFGSHATTDSAGIPLLRRQLQAPD
jgi:hypothetical protein